VHAVADSAINTPAAKPNDPHLRPLFEPSPRSMASPCAEPPHRAEHGTPRRSSS
jgi:hypothetical protein